MTQCTFSVTTKGPSMIALMPIFLLLASLSAWAAPDTIHVCLPQFREEFLTLAMMNAEDQGIFRKHNLRVEFHALAGNGKPGGGVFRGVATNDHGVSREVAKGETCAFGSSFIEHYLLNLDPAVTAKIAPVSISMYGQKYDTHLIVAQNSRIQSVKDLKGKRVRLGQMPTHLAMKKILEENGLKMSDVTIDTTPPPQVLAKLESGEIAAAVTYVPTMPYMLASGKVRILKENIVKNFVRESVPHSLIVANRAFIEKSPDVARRFSLAMDESAAYLERNPSDVIYAFQKHAKLLGQPGGWDVSKVTVERAASLVGHVHPQNLLGSPDVSVRQNVAAMTKSYGESIVKSGYAQNAANLDTWFGN